MVDGVDWEWGRRGRWLGGGTKVERGGGEQDGGGVIKAWVIGLLFHVCVFFFLFQLNCFRVSFQSPSLGASFAAMFLLPFGLGAGGAALTRIPSTTVGSGTGTSCDDLQGLESQEARGTVGYS